MAYNHTDCREYIEESAVCYSDGSPKGQCANCGAKWCEHDEDALPDSEKQDIEQLREIVKYQKSLNK